MKRVIELAGRKRHAIIGGCLLALLCFPAAIVWAATTSTTFNVSLTITASCTVSATALSFGSTGLLSSNLDATSTVTVQCSDTTPYDVGLNEGTGAGATVATRRMTAGAATVDYTLYQNAARTTVWGDTVSTDTASGVGNGADQVLTVYGRVPVQSTPAPGSYSDTITVTVTF